MLSVVCVCVSVCVVCLCSLPPAPMTHGPLSFFFYMVLCSLFFFTVCAQPLLFLPRALYATVLFFFVCAKKGIAHHPSFLYKLLFSSFFFAPILLFFLLRSVSLRHPFPLPFPLPFHTPTPVLCVFSYRLFFPFHACFLPTSSSSSSFCYLPMLTSFLLPAHYISLAF